MSRAALQAVAQPAPPKPLSRQEIIDRYGELDRLCQLHAPIAKEYEALKQQIKDWYREFPPESTPSEEGHVYKLIVSPREMEATPKLAAIWKRAGRALFFKLATVSQKAVKTEWGEQAVEELFTRERTGSRKLTVVPKLGPKLA